MVAADGSGEPPSLRPSGLTGIGWPDLLAVLGLSGGPIGRAAVPDLRVTGVTADSRLVHHGDLYVAALGATVHGARFTAEAIETLLSAEFTVSPSSDSVGLRLDGPVLTRARTDELPSEGVVRGSIQVPPDGHPIVFQADHPVTGGYPVIAVLTPAAADRAAQARPGARLRFVVAPA